MYCENEMRDINQVPRAESERMTPDELQLVQRLLDRMFDGEITAASQPVAKPEPVIDLMEALRKSMKKVAEKKTAATPPKTRKKA